MLPTAFRCMRLFFMYRLNLQKTNIFERALVAQSHAKISNAISSIIPDEVQKLENDTLATPRNSSRTNSTAHFIVDTSRKSSTSHLIIQMDQSFHHEQSLETKTPRENTPKEETVKNPSVNASQEDASDSFNEPSNSLDRKCIESPPTNTEFSAGLKYDEYVSTEVTEETTADMMTDGRTTWNGDHFRDILELKSEINKFKFYKFMLSYKVLIITYLTVLFIQMAMWLILGGVEEAVYTSGSTTPGTKRIFLLEGGMLVFERGCSMSTTMVLIIAGESVFYMIFEIVAFVLCVKSDRDTWAIKKEALSLIIFQVLFVIAFVVAGLLDIVVVLTDYFVPYGYTLMFYSFLEVIVTVTCPVVYAIVRDYREMRRSKYQKETELESILKNKKLFERLLDYSRRSFAPESVLCYRDIQHFKKSKSNQKRKAAQFIVNTYLQQGSPLELNIDNVNERGEDYTRKIAEFTEDAKIPKTLFDELEMACLVDMRDVFTRAQVDDKEIFNAVQQWKKAQANIKLEEVKR
ncbi:hypothetical protein C9374_011229 [Naegleria lovaniensis]|uniref:RGS domain-containing protein n=1 Tax=Naegleria lovaniensis TaxID=51637 RepID=A0AA88GXR9_NAELO|nr:uncharacterized protein C9374_011229 [Naegleria lovaniensis]KAG2392504.1 hypothetical protein C9374_011229 [Naegleria lovaniensis]